MTGFGKPLRLDDLPERLQRQIREGQTPRLTADPGHRGPLVPRPEKTPPVANQPQKTAKGPNKTELRYLRDVIKPLGEVGRYEALTFRMANGHRYTPDWVYADQTTGRLTCVEVKGAYRLYSLQRARLAFDQAKLEWPSITWIWATWTGQEWRNET